MSDFSKDQISLVYRDCLSIIILIVMTYFIYREIRYIENKLLSDSTLVNRRFQFLEVSVIEASSVNNTIRYATMIKFLVNIYKKKVDMNLIILLTKVFYLSIKRFSLFIQWYLSSFFFYNKNHIL